MPYFKMHHLENVLGNLHVPVVTAARKAKERLAPSQVQIPCQSTAQLFRFDREARSHHAESAWLALVAMHGTLFHKLKACINLC